MMKIIMHVALIAGISLGSMWAADFCNLEVIDIQTQSSGKPILLTIDFTSMINGTTKLPAAWRLNLDGSIDTTFGIDGQSSSPNPVRAFAFSMAIDSSDRIYAGGNVGTSIYLIRATSAGAYDVTFGSGGILAVFPGQEAFLQALAYSSDDRLILVGQRSLNGAAVGFVAKLMLDGTFDTSFNGTGFKILENALVLPTKVAVDSDNRIVLIGSSDEVSTVARLLPDGTYDTSFNTTGSYTLGSPIVKDVECDSAKRILLCGVNGTDEYIVRLTEAGLLDGSFIPPTMLASLAPIEYCAVKVFTGDVYYIAGTVYVQGIKQLAVVRLLTNGSLDTSFNGQGFVVSEVAYPIECHGITLYPSGETLAFGFQDTRSLIMKVDANGSIDRMYQSNGYLLIDSCNRALQQFRDFIFTPSDLSSVGSAYPNVNIPGVYFDQTDVLWTYTIAESSTASPLSFQCAIPGNFDLAGSLELDIHFFTKNDLQTGDTVQFSLSGDSKSAGQHVGSTGPSSGFDFTKNVDPVTVAEPADGLNHYMITTSVPCNGVFPRDWAYFSLNRVAVAGEYQGNIYMGPIVLRYRAI